MKAVIQRVLSASVAVDGNEVGTINRGFLILLGIEKDDGPEDLSYMVNKTVGLRIFKDDDDDMNLSIHDAAPHEIAESTYEKFCKKLQDESVPVQKGQFGAMMEVGLTNDGPVTIILDSRDRK
jgi:D-tyrosyl-tRNA(Tyr) deacylase